MDKEDTESAANNNSKEESQEPKDNKSKEESSGVYFTVPADSWMPNVATVYNTAWVSNPSWTVSGNPIISFPVDEKTAARIQELEDETLALKKEINSLLRTKEEVGNLQNKIIELEKNQRFQHLLSRVNEKARKKLLDSDTFKKLFDQENIESVIMSVDIRRSTELMLKAREPKLYAKFITTLCLDLLARIILENYGIFDKFTGDGILAFFPTFYSGDDAIYWAIKAADECHQCFNKHYQESRGVFNSILKDVGLGIGIDYGSAHLVQQQSAVTVIGTPVVYACRFSAAEAGQTLLNQPAYEIASKKYGEYISFQETEIDIKHEGINLAYSVNIAKRIYQPKAPLWL